jgi:hypothetical protein
MGANTSLAPALGWAPIAGRWPTLITLTPMTERSEARAMNKESLRPGVSLAERANVGRQRPTMKPRP